MVRYNLHPKEVEETLYAHPDVIEAAVIGLPDAKWIEAVDAFAVLRPGSVATGEELRSSCPRHLAASTVPKGVHFEQRLPCRGVGRFERRALRARCSTDPSLVA